MPDSNGHRRGISDRQMVLGIVGIIVAAIVIFGGGSYLLARALTVDHSDDTATERELTELVSSKYADTLEVQGVLQAAQSESISPEVDGKIKKVYVEEGDEVEEGDVLFTIKNDTITNDEKSAQTAYKDAQQSYGTALGTQQEAKTKLQDAKQQLSDAKKQSKATDEEEVDDPDADADTDSDTSKSGGSGSKKSTSSKKKSKKSSKNSSTSADVASYEASVESAQYAYDIAKAAATTARTTRDDAQTTYEAAKEQSDKLTVTATTSGTVTNVQVEKGLNVATVNAQGAAMQIVDLSSIVAIFQVPETEIYAVQEGQEVKITTAADASLKVTGNVSAIADSPTDLNTLPANLQDALNASAAQDTDVAAEAAAEDTGDEEGAAADEAAAAPASTFYAVTVSVTVDETTMKNGMMIDGEIVLEDYGNVFFVPISAVGQNGLGYFYVQVPEEDDTVRDYEVIVVGSTEDEYILRSSTLTTGTQILTTYGS